MLTWMSVNRVDVRVDEISVSVAYNRPADALRVHAIVCVRAGVRAVAVPTMRQCSLTRFKRVPGGAAASGLALWFVLIQVISVCRGDICVSR